MVFSKQITISKLFMADVRWQLVLVGSTSEPQV